jgi:hypothetical protein
MLNFPCFSSSPKRIFSFVTLRSTLFPMY